MQTNFQDLAELTDREQLLLDIIINRKFGNAGDAPTETLKRIAKQNVAFTHLHIMELDLKEMAEADEETLNHDLKGIGLNLDIKRKTLDKKGKHFIPCCIKRFSKKWRWKLTFDNGEVWYLSRLGDIMHVIGNTPEIVGSVVYLNHIHQAKVPYFVGNDGDVYQAKTQIKEIFENEEFEPSE